MGRAGRKRKIAKRERNGRVQRIPELRYDKGTERAQAMQAIYGTDGCDALGRAYRAGLLGEGNEAKALLDLGRRIAGLYWRAFATGRIVSAIADKTSGSVVELDHAKIKRQEQWLTECLTIVDRMRVRRAFDALVIDVHPDHGPLWLDQLIHARRTNHAADPVDEKRLREALDALETLAA